MTVKMMMAQPQLSMPCPAVAQEAQREVKRLGDDGPPAELDQRLERRAVGFAVGADGVDRADSTSVALGPAKRRSRVSPLVSPTARPSTSAGFFWLLGSLRSLGRSMVLCSVTTVARVGRVGQEGRGKIEIGDGRVVVWLRRAWRCRSPCRRPVESCLPSSDQANCERRCAPATAVERRGQELLHVAQAGGPLDQRAHRRAVALDLGLDSRSRSSNRSGRS